MRQWLVAFLTMCCVFTSVWCFAAEEEPLSPDRTGRNDASVKEVALSVFAVREDAEALAEKIKTSEFDTLVRAYETDDGRTVYGVFVVVHEAPAEGVGKTESGPPPGKEKAEGSPVTWKDLFSAKGGYIHAGLAVSGIYTDNAFNTKTDRKSDFSMMLSPEMWIAVPRLNQRPKGLDPISTRSPGGLLLSRDGEEGSRRYRAFLLYQSDIPQHSKNSPSGNTVTHTVNAGLGYRFPFGLSIEANNEFSRSYERLDSALSGGEVDRYRGNLFYARASLDTGNRLLLRFDYSNFLLRYDADRNKGLNRNDNSFSAYVFYRLWPKTALFTQYTFAKIAYSDDATLDSTEHRLFGGFQWDLTAKTRGTVKAGWGKKDVAGTETTDFIYEAQMEHRFTPKTIVTVTAFGQTGETNIPQTLFTFNQGVIVNYQQMLTYKMTGSLSLSYTNERYGEPITVNGKTAKRNDDYYQASLGFEYWLTKWLRAGVVYTYSARKSNFSAFDYDANTVVFGLKGSL